MCAEGSVEEWAGALKALPRTLVALHISTTSVPLLTAVNGRALAHVPYIHTLGLHSSGVMCSHTLTHAYRAIGLQCFTLQVFWCEALDNRVCACCACMHTCHACTRAMHAHPPGLRSPVTEVWGVWVYDCTHLRYGVCECMTANT